MLDPVLQYRIRHVVLNWLVLLMLRELIILNKRLCTLYQRLQVVAERSEGYH